MLNADRKFRTIIAILLFFQVSTAHTATLIYPEYEAQKVVFEFYFDHPNKIATALYWVRSLLNSLTEAPYSHAPDDIDIKIVIHGTEIVTFAKNNYAKYTDIVERARYYAALGVEFRVCAYAAQDFGYQADDLYDFVKLVPSAITDLAHWQLKGYALIVPKVWEKQFTTEEIR